MAQSTRDLGRLRDGVKRAITAFGRGFLVHPDNRGLLKNLEAGTLDRREYYRELLGLAYRLLFLFVAEDRGFLLDPSAPGAARRTYHRRFATTRLRSLARRPAGSSRSADLWRGFKAVAEKLGSDEGAPDAALSPPGSFLWSNVAVSDLMLLDLENRHLLEAVRALVCTGAGEALEAVDFESPGPEDLGSVYESLLELHPDLDIAAGTFALKRVAGHERKTSGSYYTPPSLIQCLLDSALEPVLEEAMETADPEAAILDLKVCDPACGSGRFLIAAAHRMAKRLAVVRTGEAEPAPGAMKRAARDIIGRCLYGIDVDPMAVELCKVSLWMEALEAGKPLSFLENRIVRGNSLVGTTPALMAGGIPDEAFKAMAGDCGRAVRRFKRKNRAEREGRPLRSAGTAAGSSTGWGALVDRVEDIDAVDGGSIEGIRSKERLHRRLRQSPEYFEARLAADAWCAAFLWPKTEEAPPPVTEAVFRQICAAPGRTDPGVREEILRLRRRHDFLHWHIEFPTVFRVPGGRPARQSGPWTGGFDVVLGNPPWEHTEVKEKEWFADRRLDIYQARTGSSRKQRIERLKEEDPGLYSAFRSAVRKAEGTSHFVRHSGRYPLCGRGRINTYAVFAETNRMIVAPGGRVGCIVPSGIATDDTTKFFFRDLMDRGSIVSLFDFENAVGLFPGVGHGRYKFCLLTLAGGPPPGGKGAEFVFFARRVEDIEDPERRFTLTAEDVKLLNPNTRTCSVFRSRRDAGLTRAIYRRVPVLLREGPPVENPWGVSFRQGLFNMTSASNLFRTRDQMGKAWRLLGNTLRRGKDRYLPLYEAKMIHHFNHRFGDYRDYPEGARTSALPDVPTERLADPDHVVMPRYWVPAAEVDSRLRGRWNRDWILGARLISNATNERTFVVSAFPRVGTGNSIFTLFPRVLEGIAGLLANLSSFCFDFVVRQKMGGTNLNFFHVNQFPVLAPREFAREAAWSRGESRGDWILPRVLELMYTAKEMQPMAADLGYGGPPFRWDEARRFLLRCELDAAFFHLYGIARDDVGYILETFPIVRRNDEGKWGTFRTRDTILEIHDAIERAVAAGKACPTRLDPPPADQAAAHATSPDSS